jgi:hypothetical protein
MGAGVAQFSPTDIHRNIPAHVEHAWPSSALMNTILAGMTSLSFLAASAVLMKAICVPTD